MDAECWLVLLTVLASCSSLSGEVNGDTYESSTLTQAENTVTLASNASISPNLDGPDTTTVCPDVFQRRLRLLLKEQKFSLPETGDALGTSAVHRYRRFVQEKASEIWALVPKERERQPRTAALPERAMCLEAVYRGTRWSASPPDTCAEMDCPRGSFGVMRWCCNARGYWKSPSPNTAQCVQPSILQLRSKIAAGKGEKLGPNLPNTVEQMNEFMRQSELKVGGDLLAIVDLLDTATKRLESGDVQVGDINFENAERVGKETAKTVDKLLSLDIPWNEIPAQTRYRCATTLLQTLDVAGIILSAIDLKDSSLAFKNFKMNIVSGTTANIVNQTVMLPRKSTVFNLTQSTAQIGLAPNSVSSDGDSTALVIVFTEFPRLDKLLYDDGDEQDIEQLKKELNSPVISIRIGSESEGLQLSRNVEITLPMLKSEAESPICVFWDTLLNEWSPEGCEVGSRNGTHVICLCRHLSNFGVLMDLNGVLDEALTGTSLKIITLVGCSVSVICLAICIAVFGCFRSLRNTRTSIHLNLCISLFIAEIVLMLGLDQTQDKVDITEVCKDFCFVLCTLLVLCEFGGVTLPGAKFLGRRALSEKEKCQ
ncbi:adhesion G protein-coupled receptor L2 [Ixodes scapularis]